MHICEFCNTLFNPRPQVKNPRACPDCQNARQKANEKEWHERNKGLYDKKYHRIQREKRQRTIQDICNKLLDCLKIGVKFLNCIIDIGAFEEKLSRFLLDLGIKRINKFWNNYNNNQISKIHPLIL